MNNTRLDVSSNVVFDLEGLLWAQVFPDALAPPRAGQFRPTGRDLLGWLRRM